MIAIRMFSRRWILTTLLVLAAMGVMARLGIWQLDRLEKRRAFNLRVETQLNQPELILDAQTLTDRTLIAQLAEMEYRAVRVRGEYDHSQQIALRSQYSNNQYGVHLITPLRISGSDQSILVDRGWIPAADWENGSLAQYDEPGLVEVQGMMRAPQSKADYGSRSDPTPAPGAGPLKAWNFINTTRIVEQMPYPLLAAYVQEAPQANQSGLPYRSLPKLELTEGPHMGYAIQWFTFAAILGFGYPFFIRKQEDRVRGKSDQKQTSAPSATQHQPYTTHSNSGNSV